MTPNDLYSALSEMSAVAGMNLRYYAVEQYNMWWWYSIERTIAVVFGAITMITSFHTYSIPRTDNNTIEVWAKWVWNKSTVPCAMLALIGTGLSGIYDLREWHRTAIKHSVYWAKIQEDAESALISLKKFQNDKEAPDYLVERFQELRSRRDGIRPEESAPNKDLLWKCYVEELTSRGMEIPKRPEVTK